VWVARDWGGAGWFIAWLLSLGCLIGLNVANSRGDTGLALALLVAFGVLVGASVATTVDYYADGDPVVVGQAFAATALFIGVLRSRGAARHVVSPSALVRLLLALMGAGILLSFVDIPAADMVWALAGLGIFGLYTVVDLNRLRRAGTDEAIPLAASIFLYVLNVFLLFLRLLGRSN
jgi:FtsH-binding integral membrane protein